MPKLLAISLVVGIGALLMRPFLKSAESASDKPKALLPPDVEPVCVHTRTANGKPLRVFTNPAISG